jgi:hypothetical protein
MKLDIRYFIVSLALGLFFVYLTDETPVIVVYPTPDNIDQYQIQKEGSCYSYDLHEVTCPLDAYKVDKNNAL